MRDVKYDLSQASTVPFTPKRVDSPDNKMAWSTGQRRQIGRLGVGQQNCCFQPRSECHFEPLRVQFRRCEILCVQTGTSHQDDDSICDHLVAKQQPSRMVLTRILGLRLDENFESLHN